MLDRIGMPALLHGADAKQRAARFALARRRGSRPERVDQADLLAHSEDCTNRAAADLVRFGAIACRVASSWAGHPGGAALRAAASFGRAWRWHGGRRLLATRLGGTARRKRHFDVMPQSRITKRKKRSRRL